MTAQLNGMGNLRLAVLIDADNAPRDCLRGVMEEVAVYGTPTIKRIYGDWTSPHIGSWKASLLENAVVPVQQYAYTTGKNSTDSAMIIDAMDILYSQRTDGFVLVSSDSDFTRLATRLREAGMYVIGIGEMKTPKPFIVACDKFIYIEVIRERTGKSLKAEFDKARAATLSGKNQKPGETKKSGGRAQEKPSGVQKAVPDEILSLLADSVADTADDDDFAALGAVGQLMQKKQPDFDARNYGFSKLSSMMKALARFEVDERPDPNDPRSKQVYVRDKEA